MMGKNVERMDAAERAEIRVTDVCRARGWGIRTLDGPGGDVVAGGGFCRTALVVGVRSGRGGVR
jgi:hypothetical protein